MRLRTWNIKVRLKESVSQMQIWSLTHPASLSSNSRHPSQQATLVHLKICTKCISTTNHRWMQHLRNNNSNRFLHRINRIWAWCLDIIIWSLRTRNHCRHSYSYLEPLTSCQRLVRPPAGLLSPTLKGLQQMHLMHLMYWNKASHCQVLEANQ